MAVSLSNIDTIVTSQGNVIELDKLAGIIANFEEINSANPTNSASPSGTTFNVTVATVGYYANQYYIDGVQNKSLSLYRNSTYFFNLSDSTTNSHPFFISTSQQGGDYNNEYSSGITNSRATSGTLTFTVPSDAPSILYYNCGLHSNMGGAILIQGTPTGVSGPSPAS